MSSIVSANRDYGHIKEVIERMITPYSHGVKLPLMWEGITIYCDPYKEIISDEDWDVFEETWSYYQECGVIDPIEAQAYYLASDYEWQGILVSYNLGDFWENTDGLGMFSDIQISNLDLDLGIYFDNENQFQIVRLDDLCHHASGLIRYLNEDWDMEWNERDLDNLLSVVEEITKINPIESAWFIQVIYIYWKTSCSCVERSEMISDFFAKPHITWPYWR